MARYSDALNKIINAFIKKKDELIVTGGIFLGAIIIASTLMYYAERQTQVAFSSIPKSMWWAVVTFTTVGYGDSYPVTVLGKIIASVSAIFGVAFHGLIIGILGSSFVDEFTQKS